MLYIVATPIGTLSDISIRAIETLFRVETVLCEDTRRTGFLLHELKTRYPNRIPQDKKEQTLVSYYEENEFKKLPEIIELLESGNDVALVSDGGMPIISDPGFLLVREARKRSIPLTVIPGPTAIATALALSGLPPQPHTFVGFLPEKEGPRIKLLGQMKTAAESLPTTYTLYCAPHKLETTLTNMREVFGDIEIVIARELTKMHEDVWSGLISLALASVNDFKGEIVVLWRLP